jgi:phospholipid transport system substrate-binding protein
MDEMKTHTDRSLGALQNPALKGPGHRVERQAVIRASMNAVVDFAEMSRRMLGSDWAARTPAEQAEFTRVFGEFLTSAYVNQIDLYKGETLVYEGDRIEGDLATVTARLEAPDGDRTVIEFMMHRVAAGWRVHDVAIDHISIMDNYRAQFRQILRKGTWAELMARLKKPPAAR